MRFEQTSLTVQTHGRKALLVTNEVLEACGFIRTMKTGMLQVFIRHTSASLTINENSDTAVREDLVMALDTIAPETLPYTHDEEGPDDMPAHVKASLMGASVLIPIRDGKLALGQWQGIYLCEHRAVKHVRELICSAWGI
ncbi:MAG: secondary thiamine-phosphate synthase enzyme YjbQ [Bdellovibrionota bacterium]|nr:MAG: YjbQ family protein [Pseudomonadota bacterium]